MPIDKNSLKEGQAMIIEGKFAITKENGEIRIWEVK
jgi:hypothetical protein